MPSAAARTPPRPHAPRASSTNRRTDVGPCFWVSPAGHEYFFRPPGVSDGAILWQLAKESGGLDLNSPYSYLMLGAHFADTCAIAERDARPVGFVSAFRSPMRPDTLFVWQVAVSRDERGQGLAKELLKHVLARPACRGVRQLEATVTPSNTASAALFQALAHEMGVPCRVVPGLTEDLFPGSHEREDTYVLGPMPRPARRHAGKTMKTMKKRGETS